LLNREFDKTKKGAVGVIKTSLGITHPNPEWVLVGERLDIGAISHDRLSCRDTQVSK
jgi:hypothetical protein